MKTWPTTRCVMTRFVFLFYASFCLHLIQVNTAPLNPEKTGDKEEHENAGPEQSTLDSMEEKVQETVHKAEQAASQAAKESVRHGHKAETRVLAVKNTEHAHAHRSENSDTSETDKHDKKHQDGVSTENKRNFKVEVRDSWQAKAHYNPLLEAEEGKTEQGIKQHRLHHKMEGISKVDAGLGPLSLMGTAGSNAYKEDTKLEDRLAMEAEEEKKFENGESYGGYDEGVATDKSANWESNIQRQDAAEKQSIQAQVASESANELNQIQQAIATESQTSQGTASIGDGGATVVQVGANGMQNGNRPREQEQPRARAESSMESPPKVEQQEIANIISQADKLSPSELKGPPPAALSAAIHTGLGSLQNREQASLGSQDFQQALGGGEAGQEQSMEQGMQQPSEQAFTQSFNQEASQAQPETGGAEGLNPEQAAFTGNSLLSTQSQSAALQSPSPNLLANQPFQTQTQGNEQALTRTAETGTSLGGSIGGNMLAGQGAMLTQGSTQSLMGQGGLAQQGFVAAPMAQGMTGMTQGMVGQMPVVGGLQPMTFKKSFIPKHKQRHPDKLTIQRSKLDKISEVEEKSSKKILKGKHNVLNRRLSVTSHRGKQSKKSKLSHRPLHLGNEG